MEPGDIHAMQMFIYTLIYIVPSVRTVISLPGKSHTTGDAWEQQGKTVTSTCRCRV